ncbi:hypothetical protein ACIBBB_34945 [Streptomyces sp. NPDC051217]|uniref:hypothetical protein n=1 Tax=Streptomyces sp. NPDC051217 TaxID=3365644 RepID=UPI00379CD2AC
MVEQGRRDEIREADALDREQGAHVEERFTFMRPGDVMGGDVFGVLLQRRVLLGSDELVGEPVEVVLLHHQQRGLDDPQAEQRLDADAVVLPVPVGAQVSGVYIAPAQWAGVPAALPGAALEPVQVGQDTTGQGPVLSGGLRDGCRTDVVRELADAL